MICNHFQSTIGASGINAKAEELLDMGNENFSKVPEEIRGAVYLAAIEQGWQDNGILSVIKELMGKRYDNDIGMTVLSMLKESAAKNSKILS